MQKLLIRFNICGCVCVSECGRARESEAAVTARQTAFERDIAVVSFFPLFLIPSLARSNADDFSVNTFPYLTSSRHKSFWIYYIF